MSKVIRVDFRKCLKPSPPLFGKGSEFERKLCEESERWFKEAMRLNLVTGENSDELWERKKRADSSHNYEFEYLDLNPVTVND